MFVSYEGPKKRVVRLVFFFIISMFKNVCFMHVLY